MCYAEVTRSQRSPGFGSTSRRGVDSVLARARTRSEGSLFCAASVMDAFAVIGGRPRPLHRAGRLDPRRVEGRFAGRELQPGERHEGSVGAGAISGLFFEFPTGPRDDAREHRHAASSASRVLLGPPDWLVQARLPPRQPSNQDALGLILPTRWSSPTFYPGRMRCRSPFVSRRPDWPWLRRLSSHQLGLKPCRSKLIWQAAAKYRRSTPQRAAR